VERAVTEDPDVVLVDLAMPRMDGLTALQRLSERKPRTPVVMMSGRATLQDAVAATRLGAFQFLEKPLTPEAVVWPRSAARWSCAGLGSGPSRPPLRQTSSG
jgi:DNA-binding NtrC family response regulator